MLQELLQSLLEKLWKKWLSVPILIAIMVLALIANLPEEWKLENTDAVKFYVLSFVLLLFLVSYMVICAKENRLPHASSLAVLFIIDTENEALYNDIRHRLVTNFNDCFWGNEDSKFSSICIRSSELKKYDLHKTEDQVMLLKKTNCALFVRVRYHVDDTTNTENYETNINYGIVHPTLQNQAKEMLQWEMNALSIPIKKRRFQKAQTLDTLDFTAQALSIICQYLYALVCLLVGKHMDAYIILHKMREDAQKGTEASQRYDISVLVNKRLFQACMGIAQENYDEFYRSKSINALETINHILDEANTIFPNTYDFFLGKAYYYVAHDLDGEKAKQYICECKKISGIDTWKYSEAFLAAFFHNSPTTILRKYNTAFRVGEDLPRIADYIEYIIDKSPDRYDLHFAVGLVYDAMGDPILAKEHFQEYLVTENGKKMEKYIKRKLIQYEQDQKYKG